MDRYYFIDHTADIRLVVESSNIKQLFATALKGMNELLDPIISDDEVQTVEIMIESNSIELLLIDFLSEILYLSNKNKSIYKVNKIFEINNKTIKCELYGSKIERFAEDIKAVTYHEAELIEEDGLLKARVIFDL